MSWKIKIIVSLNKVNLLRKKQLQLRLIQLITINNYEKIEKIIKIIKNESEKNVNNNECRKLTIFDCWQQMQTQILTIVNQQNNVIKKYKID